MKISCGNIMSQIKVKHFGVILFLSVSHSVPLYTLPHVKDTYPALFIMFGSMEFVFFSPITRAFLLINIAVRQISRSTFFSTFVCH